MKIHGTAKAGALSKKNFGVAFSTAGAAYTQDTWDSATKNNGTISTTTITNDTFTGDSGGSASWDKYCSSNDANDQCVCQVNPSTTKNTFIGILANQDIASTPFLKYAIYVKSDGKVNITRDNNGTIVREAYDYSGESSPYKWQIIIDGTDVTWKVNDTVISTYSSGTESSYYASTNSLEDTDIETVLVT